MTCHLSETPRAKTKTSQRAGWKVARIPYRESVPSSRLRSSDCSEMPEMAILTLSQKCFDSSHSDLMHLYSTERTRV